jgi:ABC-type multidrug transport system fused ATPase/permease subunit
MFAQPKSCMAFMPVFILFLLIAPDLILLLVTLVFSVGLKLFTMAPEVQGGAMLYGLMILSPHGALVTAMLAATGNVTGVVTNFPPAWATLLVMTLEAIAYLAIAYTIDIRSVSVLEAKSDPYFNDAVLQGLDEDVQAERTKTLKPDPNEDYPLSIQRLRKVFPPKKKGGTYLEAVQDVAFSVKAGEIFGLLGANGAGKSTTLSMLTRHHIPHR